MTTFTELVNEAPEITKVLVNHQHFWAHLCEGKNPELLSEHLQLVGSYAGRLVAVHGLDSPIDTMALAASIQFKGEKRDEYIGTWVKRLFVEAIIYHDFGKVNECFQAERMQNGQFKTNSKNPLKPRHGHSYLGCYLYVSNQIVAVVNGNLTDEEKTFLVMVTLFFGYSIQQHHSPILDKATADSFLKSFQNYHDDLNTYLVQYSIRDNEELLNSVYSSITDIWESSTDDQGLENAMFSLYALVKLNSSLLTASDYLATNEYINGEVLVDFGILDSRSRIAEIIAHLRSYRHNATIFAEMDTLEFTHPIEKSNANLNHLRKEMAVEAVQTLRANISDRLFYLEAPTGGGKTNLSMLAVAELLEKHEEINKVYYVFPFTTLITQTYQSLKDSFGFKRDELVELHSKAPMADKEATEDGLYGDKKKNYIDNLFALYPITVLSHVKFFDILKSNQKESNYLLHRLANSIVIIDELQTYNPKIWDKMSYFISEYARFFNIRFILMSATLPKISRLDIPLTSKPQFIDLLPNAKQYLCNPNFANRVEFRFDLFDREIELPELADVVCAKSKEYAKCNQPYHSVHTIIEFIYKKSASEFYRIMENLSHPFDEVVVLSGTILEHQRKRVINLIKNKDSRSKSILLITTQVVEAGVDIDMDLGFKNISLIDGDEQLAGRVNRNASKPTAQVYLFRADRADRLYGADYRYKVTCESIHREQYEQILAEKRFEQLYNLVFSKVNQWNNLEFAENLASEFMEKGIHQLNFKKVDEEFTIINQKTVSIFVPCTLPIMIPSEEEGQQEQLFSADDLRFLADYQVYPSNGEISGVKVWNIYELLISNNGNIGFSMESKINHKLLQAIMAKFTFSLMHNSSDVNKILCGFGEEKYGYIYFSYWNDIRNDGMPYSLEMGLNSAAFGDANFI